MKERGSIHNRTFLKYPNFQIVYNEEINLKE